MYIGQKTEMLHSKFKQYLGFQFLLTSPSLFVPPENPNIKEQCFTILCGEKLTNESVMRHIEGCIVQGGDVVSFWGRSLNVSAHFAAAAVFIFSQEILLSAPLCLYLSPDPSFSVELLSLRPLLLQAVSGCQLGSRQLTSLSLKLVLLS